LKEITKEGKKALASAIKFGILKGGRKGLERRLAWGISFGYEEKKRRG